MQTPIAEPQGSTSPSLSKEEPAGKRRRKVVDYAKLAAEMFGEGHEGEAVEDDDWSPRAAGVTPNAHDDDC